jgi:FSR family fosmidomycin resistance protein-like MFS transporter
MNRGDDRRRAMALLGIVISLRSVAWFTLLAFVPLWVVSLGHSKADGNRLLFVMLLSGAAGTLLLGPVADRIGLRVTLVVTQALLTPLILVFVYVGGAVGVVALMLVGVCVVGTFGVTMVLSQLYLPRHVGMASGLSVGLAMGIGGLAAVASGAIADAVGLKTALTVSALAPALGVVFCLRLPAPAARAEAQTRPAAALSTD